MRFSCAITTLLLSLAQQIAAAPVEGNQGQRLDIEYNVDTDRADAVKEAFLFAWNGYLRFAFPHDELKPVSRTFGDSRNGWGASAVDALSTAILMDLPQVVDKITEHISTIDYSRTSSDVSVFETTIRYLGGMLAGYDLLRGPFAHLATNDTQVDLLLTQSQKLADLMAFAFNTSSGVPDNTIGFSDLSMRGGGTTGLAVAGTLVLEWTRLSDLTGNRKYAQLAQKAEDYLLNPMPATSEPFPGLVGTSINLSDGQFLDSRGGWTGGTDSFYEYLIKMWVYDDKYAKYRDRWIQAADSSMKYIASHPITRPELTFLAIWDGKTLTYESEHLACFDGGNFLLGGLVLGEQKYIDFGLELTKGCRATYGSTLTGIGPEVFRWTPETCVNTTTYVMKRQLPSKRSPSAPAVSPYRNSSFNPPSATNNFAVQADSAAACSVPKGMAEFNTVNGYYITDASYDVRPEVIESYYYAYRITGDRKYQEWAWEAFVAINKTARQGEGFTRITNVNAPGGGRADDNQESFLFAEVMKYAYLIFAEDGEWQINYEGIGEKEMWVFNTEAHPFRVNNAGYRKSKKAITEANRARNSKGEDVSSKGSKGKMERKGSS